jgi:hypothetical protein
VLYKDIFIFLCSEICREFGGISWILTRVPRSIAPHARPAAFVGEVDTGRQYVVIDDHVGLGGTIANIRGHIERHGGVVLLATTSTASAGSQHIALKPAMLGKLRDKHGKALEAWWRKTFGHGLECLTNPEAGYLFRTPDVERIRDRLAAEERRSFP